MPALPSVRGLGQVRRRRGMGQSGPGGASTCAQYLANALMSFPPISTAASLGPVAEVLSALMINGATSPTQAAQQAVAQLSQEYCGAIAAETSETDPGTPASPDCSDGGMAAANAAYPQFLAYYSQLPASFWGGTGGSSSVGAPSGGGGNALTIPTCLLPPSVSALGPTASAEWIAQCMAGLNPATPATTPAPLTTPVVATTATLENTSAPGQPFVAGDSFTLTIIGSPGVAVNEISSTQNGNSMGGAAFGSTDSTGTLLISGTFSQNDVGNWQENWQAGSGAPAILSFQVAASPSQGSGSGSNAGGSMNSVTPLNPTTGATPQFLGGGSLAFLGPFVDFLGSDVAGIPMWGIVAAGVVVLVVMPKKL